MNILKPESRGPEVMKVQATLKKIGFDVGPIDGIFGNKTSNAVIQFQTSLGLPPTGIIDSLTYSALERFILGYDVRYIRPYDTLYSLSKLYHTNLQSILTANPNLDPTNLIIGQKVKIPYGIDVVDTNIDYTYDVLKQDIIGLRNRYPFLIVGSAGKSLLGRELYYFKLGTGPNKVFFNAAHHSLEWITTPLLMKFVEQFSKAYSNGEYLEGYNPREIWEKSTIYVMPMVNPDGVDLVLNGLKKDNPYYDDLIKWNKGSTDFSKDWQANNRGVDLNHNYDASWNLSKEAEASYGIIGPGPTRYSGEYAESEPESKAVADFTRKHNFNLVLAFHSQGEVLYWNYKGLATEEDKQIAQSLANVSGYTLSETYGITSYAGYKDWFIDKFRKPGITVEVGLGTNPLPISQFDKIYSDNIKLLLLASIITAV